MTDTGREARVWLPLALVRRLGECRPLLGLGKDASVVSVVELLANRCLATGERADTPGKRVRGSATGAARELFSETALAALGWSVTELKHRALPESAALRQGMLTDPLRQLVLLVPETPRSPTELSRDVVVALLVEGVKECETQRTEALNRELAAVDRIGVDFFGSHAIDGTLEHLSAEFARTCPILQQLFSDLAIGPHTGDNTIRTPAIKMEWMLVLASAIGKVRNVRRCGFAAALYVVWRSLGVPGDAIDVLANLGLSVSARDGAERTKIEVDEERRKLARTLKVKGAAEGVCVVFDNIDVLLGTRSFVKSEVDARSRLIHVTAASVMYHSPLPQPIAPGARPVGVLPYASLFADWNCQQRLGSAICNVMHEVLHPFGHSVLGCGKGEAPSRPYDFGSLERTRRQALPVYWLEEGKIDDMYEFTKDVLGRFRDGSQVHFVGDCFSLQKLLSVRELLYGENLSSRPDPEDFPVVLVPGWFHLYWNVFLGSLLNSDRDLLERMIEIGDLRNLKLHKDIGTCFNDVDHVVTLLLPVVIVRLFNFFRGTVAVAEGLNLKQMPEGEVMQRFTLFVVGTVRALGRAASGPVTEWQRYCRVAVLLCVYRSLRVAIASENHVHMVDVLHFSVTLVCQSSFRQYRKVIIEAVAHFARSSAAEKQKFMQCFTANFSGGHHGGRAVDEVREFDNKAVKEALRRTHRSEGDLAPELELTERQREITQVFATAFRTLETSSGGAVPTLPAPEVVTALVARAQWPSMLCALPQTVAKKQMSFFDVASHVQMVRETLESLFRTGQFE
jgi:hypothetical protein